MKPMAWASIVLALLLSASSTQGQGFRGGGGGMSGGAAISGGGSMGGFGSAGGTAGVGRGTIGTAPPAAPVSPAPVQRGGGFATAPQATAPSSAMQQQNLPSSTIGPQFRHRGGHGFIPPPPFVRPRPFFLGVAPFHPHRNWFFWRYPRFAFYDVPYFVDSGTVITQVAPGVIRADRDQSEESPSDQQTRGPGQLAPFDPTPQDVVERMLTLAAVKKGDVIYDLGAGDGRILITAARKYGVRGVGYEIDSGLAKLARENVRKQGVERLVEIRQEDFLGADLSPASVVALYLSQDGNLAVRQLLMNQLKTGARVVSYTFDMGEWVPKIAESYRDANGDAHLIYLWQIGEPPLFSNVSSQMLQPQASRRGPLIIDVK